MNTRSIPANLTYHCHPPIDVQVLPIERQKKKGGHEGKRMGETTRGCQHSSCGWFHNVISEHEHWKLWGNYLWGCQRLWESLGRCSLQANECSLVPLRYLSEIVGEQMLFFCANEGSEIMRWLCGCHWLKENRRHGGALQHHATFIVTWHAHARAIVESLRLQRLNNVFPWAVLK